MQWDTGEFTDNSYEQRDKPYFKIDGTKSNDKKQNKMPAKLTITVNGKTDYKQPFFVVLVDTYGSDDLKVSNVYPLLSIFKRTSVENGDQTELEWSVKMIQGFVKATDTVLDINDPS